MINPLVIRYGYQLSILNCNLRNLMKGKWERFSEEVSSESG